MYPTKVWGYDAIDARNDVWYSNDGITWTQATASAAFPAVGCQSSVVFDSKIWTLGGFYRDWREINARNEIWHSTDGISWMSANSKNVFTARGGHSSVVYNGNIWVIGGSDSLAA
jgi:hypothetical protein